MSIIGRVAAGLLLAVVQLAPANAESISTRTHVNASPDFVWDAVRAYSAVHERLVPCIVSAVEMDGNTRIVTVADGTVVKERLVSVDDETRRLVYSAYGGKTTVHMSSLQVLTDGEGSKLVWITAGETDH